MIDMDETAVEAVAFALWKNAAQRAAPNVAKYRTIAAFRDDVQDSDRAVWLQSARAALAANPATARVAKLEEALRGLIGAIDATRYGDDTIWDDLDGFGSKPGPLDIARQALASGDSA